jgi:hypothetical protein
MYTLFMDPSLMEWLKLTETKSRTIPLGKASRKAVWRYLVTRPGAESDEPLFLTKEGRKLEHVMPFFSKLISPRLWQGKKILTGHPVNWAGCGVSNGYYL